MDEFEKQLKTRRLGCSLVFHLNGGRTKEFCCAWEEAAATIGRPGLLFHDLRDAPSGT
jgi:hypothetical protein